jgi:glucose-6-phosphate 1-dehydrogenase
VLLRAVRGQYGRNHNGALGYRQEPLVSPASRTETFVALKLFVDNWRWAGVPFYIRTGKRLARRVTEIVVQFKRAPFVLFRKTAVEKLEPNRLALHLQPEEGISLSFGAKVPGHRRIVGPAASAQLLANEWRQWYNSLQSRNTSRADADEERPFVG